ncbi:MAG: hypothetical protein SFX72_12395 [Isosphaeraceae bacterium]|nr:hypothetical protein [Isosphaeraceae bacterium]
MCLAEDESPAPLAIGTRPTSSASPLPSSSPPLAMPVVDRAEPIRPAAANSTRPAAVVAAPVAAARFEGLPAPGVQILLSSDGSVGANLKHRWIQTLGPRVELTTPTAATTRLTVPEQAARLEFLLVVSNEGGMDSVPLVVEVEGGTAPATVQNLRADAGDDQIAVIGRQITLNGGRSEPRGRIGYRWIQTAGPRVGIKLEQGAIFSFVPTAPETYRFALVVASEGAISEPDEVTVTTQLPPGVAGPASPPSQPGSDSPAVRVNFDAPPMPRDVSRQELLSDFVRNRLGEIGGGASKAAEVEEAFSTTIARMPLYGSYREIHAEMSRRLDTVVPRDEASRRLWLDRLFMPITSRLVDELKREGLDMTTPQGWDATLSPTQKARLTDVFQAVAIGARSSAAR